MSYQATPTTASASTSTHPATINPFSNNINGDVLSSNMTASTGANASAGTSNGTGPGLQIMTSEGIGKGVPAFLVKLYSMINEPKTDELIYWSEDGKSFFSEWDNSHCHWTYNGICRFVCRSKSGVVFGADFGYIPSPGHSTKFSEIRWNSVTSILQTREFHILRQTVEHVWIQ